MWDWKIILGIVLMVGFSLTYILVKVIMKRKMRDMDGLDGPIIGKGSSGDNAVNKTMK